MTRDSAKENLDLAEIRKDFPDQSDRLPESLVKFTDHAGLNILLKGELKITPPREFNDPFEFNPGCLEGKPTPEELREHFTRKESFGREVLFQAAIGNSDEEKEEDYSERVVPQAIQHGEISREHLGWLRDAVLSRIPLAYGVACFAAFDREQMQSAKAVRHWAIYGNNHRGLAVEFDGRNEFFRQLAEKRICFKVDYPEKRPTCSLADFNNRNDAWLILPRRWGAVKSIAWKPEDEWRILLPLPASRREPNGGHVLYLVQLWDLPNPEMNRTSMIRRITLGYSASADLEASVLATVAQPHLQHVEVCRAIPHDDEFRLDLRVIRPPTAPRAVSTSPAPDRWLSAAR